MESKTFTVTGTYTEKGSEKKFSKEISSHNEAFAREKLLSTIGSKHKIARKSIKITMVKEKGAK